MGSDCSSPDNLGDQAINLASLESLRFSLMGQFLSSQRGRTTYPVSPSPTIHDRGFPEPKLDRPSRSTGYRPGGHRNICSVSRCNMDDFNANSFVDTLRAFVERKRQFIVATCDVSLYRLMLVKLKCLNQAEGKSSEAG
jgi:hypothetical protein